MSFAAARRLGALDKAALLGVPAACICKTLEAYLRTDVADADPPRCCQYAPASSLLTDGHVRRLERNGFLILEGCSSVLSEGALAAARSDVRSICEGGERFAMNPNDRDVRQDLVCWLRETDGTPQAPDPIDRSLSPIGPGLLHCARLLRGLTYALESHGYNGSHKYRVPKQLQLAWYPGDGKSEYVRHLDSCIESPLTLGLLGWLGASDYRSRTVTAILYLNDPVWAPVPSDVGVDPVPHAAPFPFEGKSAGGNGGELRIYVPSDGNVNASPSAERHVDVVPSGGTLVMFDSRRVEHQVIPTPRDRFALTCWIAGEAL